MEKERGGKFISSGGKIISKFPSNLKYSHYDFGMDHQQRNRIGLVSGYRAIYGPVLNSQEAHSVRKR